MSPPRLPNTSSPRELRKSMLRMRMEMHRQELRHETLVMMQPIRKVQHFGSHWREELRENSTSLWMTGGALLLATFGVRQTNWRRLLRIALVVVPLLRKQSK
ncbi:MAG: hypothetical protein ACN6O6_15895 [Pseudomonas sp.]|uniref:hypothetical protein n=1 Tax=Pseudomonas sp. TaxID=306 RepID=UPI003D0ED745